MHNKTRYLSPLALRSLGLLTAGVLCVFAASAQSIKLPSDASADGKHQWGKLSVNIPDTPVFDQNGKQLKFYSDLIKGKTVAINFIFTTCTTICPPLTATFRKVQKDLSARAAHDVQLISISVDPMGDSPAALKAFSTKFGADAGWSFVTGNKQDVNELLKALGAYTTNKMDHTPMIIIGNDVADVWTRTYGLSNPSALVKLIGEATAKSTNALNQNVK